MHKKLYFWVLVGVMLGVLLGGVAPQFAVSLKPIADDFIQVIRFLVPFVVICTLVPAFQGVGGGRAGKIGGVAIVYFEIVSTVALVIGLLAVNVFKPGLGLNVDPGQLDATKVAAYEGKGLGQLLLNALQANILLKVLVGSVLVGLVLRYAGKRGQQGFNLIRGVSKLLFKGINLIMWVSPVVALSAMASTIGKSGLGSLVQLGQLVVTFYGACVVFVAVVLGTIARWHGFSIWKLVRYLKDEIFLVYGTSTSDVVLPRLMDKLEAIGADRSVVGLVTPAGYSLNLDGSNIYLPLGALFIAQATNTPVGLGEQLWLLALLVLTSKGVAPVAGAGFIVLCTTLTTLGGTIPLVGLAVIFGVEPFMGRGCAVTNVIGNATASLVLARRFGVLDDKKLKKM